MKLSDKNEGTSYPYWIIIDPSRNFKTDSDGVYNIANMITGVWFSREKAEEFLNRTRYNFSEHAKVFCASGTYSEDWVKFCKTNKSFDVSYKAAAIIAIYDFFDKGGICSYKEDKENYYSESFFIKNAKEAILKIKEGQCVDFKLNGHLCTLNFYENGEVKIEEI